MRLQMVEPRSPICLEVSVWGFQVFPCAERISPACSRCVQVCQYLFLTTWMMVVTAGGACDLSEDCNGLA